MTARPPDRRVPSRLRDWVAEHRGQIRFALVLIAVAVVFFVIGATAPRVIMPGACKVYG
jgi:hypothetical protein